MRPLRVAMSPPRVIPRPNIQAPTPRRSGINFTANVQADFVLPLPLARLMDIEGGAHSVRPFTWRWVQNERRINEGDGCAREIGGVTTIKNAAPPNLTLDFSWNLPAERIILPGQPFEYHLGFMTDAQAFQFPEGSAATKFSGFSVPCP